MHETPSEPDASDGTAKHDPDSQEGTVARDIAAASVRDTGSSTLPRWMIGVIAVAALVVAGLITAQILTLNALNENRAGIESLNETLAGQVESIGDEINGLAKDIADLGTSVQALVLAPQAEAGGASTIEPPAASVPAGYLPRFERDAPDQALGMTMGTIEGTDAYTDQPVSIDPADGTRRVWMVWAHWCPYCQQEIPLLSDWYPEASERYETELVTVTTSIDPSRGNPLDAYLDNGDFPFPIVVDASNRMAAKMGVSAFPFWVVTSGSGEVLLRAPGLLQTDHIEELFEQVENIGA
ncbi:MAG: TlpA disulfide reductase family protein [Acidimicrobiia bacterium]